MSVRMQQIKQRLRDRDRARPRGGWWQRVGECHRCGTCCNILLTAPEEFEKIQEQARKSGAIPSVANLDPVCKHYQSLPEQGGRMGCVLHETDAYPEGCAAFPDSPEQWYRVMEVCGYEYVWRERKAGKARRRRP